MTYLIGIDGGGSQIRVAIVTPNMDVCAQTNGPRVNPNVIGRAKSAEIIQAQMRQALAQASLQSGHIAGVGVGIAGTAAAQWRQWLREVIVEITPQSQIVVSSDMEIALVGARGMREGVLLLAGTGSSAYGVRHTGESLQVGGWGYLMGDEGSGYWLGIQALRAITRAFDAREDPTGLTDRIMGVLDLQAERDLVTWLYGQEMPRTTDVARLAPQVLEAAENDDTVARQIVEEASRELALLGQTVMRRLSMEPSHIAFAGGLLEHPNILSTRLCQRLNLETLPATRYPPVIGAALLAQLMIEGKI